MSSITGAGFTSGAAGAGLNEAVIKEIDKIAKHDPGAAQIRERYRRRGGSQSSRRNSGSRCRSGGKRDKEYSNDGNATMPIQKDEANNKDILGKKSKRQHDRKEEHTYKRYIFPLMERKQKRSSG